MARQTKLKINGREMVIFSSGAGARIKSDTAYSDYCLERGDARSELDAFMTVCQLIQDAGGVNRVVELFGGVGWHSLAIQQVCDPEEHDAYDHSEDCVKSIAVSLPEVRVSQADSYAVDLPSKEADWIHADFNNLTLMKLLAAEKNKQFVQRIFNGASEWVTLTDSAIFGIKRFQRNLTAYGELLGAELEAWQDYYREIAHLFAEVYGFGLVDVVIWGGFMASMMTFRRAGPIDYEIRVHTGKAPLEVLEVVETE